MKLSFYDILFKRLYKYSRYLFRASLALFSKTIFRSDFIPDLNYLLLREGAGTDTDIYNACVTDPFFSLMGKGRVVWQF